MTTFDEQITAQRAVPTMVPSGKERALNVVLSINHLGKIVAGADSVEVNNEIARLIEQAYSDGAAAGIRLATLEAQREAQAGGDAMERAQKIVLKYIRLGVRFVVKKNVYAEDMKKDIAAAIREAEARADRLLAALEQPSAALTRCATEAAQRHQSYIVFNETVCEALRAAAEHLRKTT